MILWDVVNSVEGLLSYAYTTNTTCIGYCMPEPPGCLNGLLMAHCPNGARTTKWRNTVPATIQKILMWQYLIVFLALSVALNSVLRRGRHPDVVHLRYAYANADKTTLGVSTVGMISSDR